MYGFLANFVCLFIAAVSTYAGSSIGRFVGSLLFLGSFQLTMGTFFYSYLNSIAQIAAIGYSYALLFLFNTIFSLWLSSSEETLESGTCFLLFALGNLTFAVFTHFFLEVAKNESKQGAKQIYFTHDQQRKYDESI